ncbi:MAG: PQQ-like beta-propeller repeat protein, partial [Planctomycetes bacterium]|nr:PQQ-like beta-propeller repeat protein [Planctomycetota bacterium]
AQRKRSENRFHLRFPPDVPATLDHDTETLGRYLPPSRLYKPVLNVVEQSMSRRLDKGQSACFQNLFYAATSERPKTFELRRLNDHCALIQSGAGLALIGASADKAEAKVGALEASGPFFFVSESRCVLAEGAKMAKLDGPAIRSALAQAWQDLARSAPVKASRPSERPGDGSPTTKLQVKAKAELPSPPLVVAVSTAGVLVGGEDGVVRRYDASGKLTGQFKTAGPVHTICPADLDGNGKQEILVGSDDEHVYALNADLTERWRYKVPFLREEQIWLWWTLGSSKVRKAHAADLNGDGKPEILLGVGNMRLHCLDASGKELWRFRTDHGIPTTILTTDVFGDGNVRVLIGNGLLSSAGTCWVLDERGKLLQSCVNDGWCTRLPSVAVADLDRDGVKTLFCGNNRGNLRAWAVKPASREPLWLRNLAGTINSLTVVPRPQHASDLLAVGSDSGYLAAFDEKGEKAWGLPLSSAIVKTGLLRSPQLVGGEPRTSSGLQRTGRDSDPPLVVAGCRDGKLFVVSADGKLAALFDCQGRLRDLLCADVDGDGYRKVIVVTSGPNCLWVLNAP